MSDPIPKKLLFAREYVVDRNATKAAQRAGYSERTAYSQGQRLLKDVEVQAEVDRLTVAKAERTDARADDVIRELLRLGFSDIGELFDESGALRPLREIPEQARRAIASIEVVEERDKDGETLGVVRKVKLWDKTKALEALGRHLKLFTDKVEHSGRVEIEDARDELRRLIEKARAKRAAD